MCMEFLQFNVAVVCGYLCECFCVFCRREQGINIYGTCTG